MYQLNIKEQNITNVLFLVRLVLFLNCKEFIYIITHVQRAADQ